MFSSFKNTFPLANSVLHVGFESIFHRTGLESLWIGAPVQRSFSSEEVTWSTATPANVAVFAQIPNLIAMYDISKSIAKTAWQARKSETKSDLINGVVSRLYGLSTVRLDLNCCYFSSQEYAERKEHSSSLALYYIDYPWSLCARALWIGGNIALAVATIPVAVIAAVGDVGMLCLKKSNQKTNSTTETPVRHRSQGGKRLAVQPDPVHLSQPLLPSTFRSEDNLVTEQFKQDVHALLQRFKRVQWDAVPQHDQAHHIGAKKIDEDIRKLMSDTYSPIEIDGNRIGTRQSDYEFLSRVVKGLRGYDSGAQPFQSQKFS